MKGGSILADWPEIAAGGSPGQAALAAGREEAEELVEELLPGALEASPEEAGETGDSGESSPEPAAESQSDLGYFLSQAGRFALLSASREKELATALWSSRRQLVRAMEMARRSRGEVPIALPRHNRVPKRPLSRSARRRLIAAEDYGERLLRWVDGSNHAGEGFDRSLTEPPPLQPAPRPGRRSRNSVAPLLSRKQARAIAPVLKEELESIRAVREELVEHNLRLVVWVAKAYRGRGLDLVDLIQEGSMGLLRAIDRFDPAVGTRFSTFATHWIRQGMLRALAEKARAIRVPLNRLHEVKEALEARSRLAEKLEREPTPAEIAAEMGVDPKKVEELSPALSPIDSIDAPLASTDLRPADLLADFLAPSPLEEAIEQETVSVVQGLLSRMPERERLILAMRYGIGYPREATLEEIGSSLGLSRERIRQIELEARRELRSMVLAARPHLAGH